LTSILPVGYALAMPRPVRYAPGGFVYHVLNRAVARLPLFQKPADYEAFERVLVEAQEKYPTRLLAYCLMSNHWHLVLWPNGDRQLTDFVRWLTHTHAMRWHAHYQTEGTGHLYQGRFKSFPVEADDHLLTVLRYVERNPVRAGLVSRAEQWRWSSAWRTGQASHSQGPALAEWPMARPRRWLEWVNQPLTDAELAAVRRSVVRGSPYGGEPWQQRVVRELGLEATLRPRGRPKKQTTVAGGQ
jgi:putative transposase